MAKLRVGVLMDSLVVPAWALSMLQRISQSDYAEINLFVLNCSQDQKKGLFAKIKNNAGHLLYILYSLLEQRVVKVYPNAFELRDARQLFGEVPTIQVMPKRTKFSDWILEPEVEKIRGYDLDVLIRLGFRILRGQVLTSARYGVWSYHHGDSQTNRGGPAATWEVLRDEPLTGSVLQILSEDLDNGRILTKSYSSTHYSVLRNRNNLYWKSASFLPRNLELLHRLGGKLFLERVQAQNCQLDFYSDRLFTTPTNGVFMVLLMRFLVRYFKYKIDALCFFDQWVLLFDLRENMSTSLWRFKRIVPPKDRFWADPNVVYRDNHYYIFLEEFMFSENKGHIAVIVMDEKGNHSKPVKVLDSTFHMSYPFVFEWNGDHYMIPETSSKKTIEIYKASEFPAQWEFQKTLMENIVAVDATLFQYRGQWWLFANIRENEGASKSEELFLFYADSPLSDEWHAHPQNPIVSDVTRSRPAGSLFVYNELVYRPSQDCSRGYGYGIRINQVVTLTENEYREVEVSFIKPRWDSKITGVHTIQHEHRLTLFDAKLKRIKIP
jgi:hypothetical protein